MNTTPPGCCLICYEGSVITTTASSAVPDVEAPLDVVTDSAATAAVAGQTAMTDLTQQHRRQLICLQDCSHTFCVECLESHCEHNLLITKRVPIPCPCHGEDPPCTFNLSKEVVQQALLGTNDNNNDDDDDKNNNNETCTTTIHRKAPTARETSKPQESSPVATTETVSASDLNSTSSSSSSSSGSSIMIDRPFVHQMNDYGETATATATTATTTTTTLYNNNTNHMLWKRYLKLTRMAQDSTLVSCPRCDELVSPLSSSMTTRTRTTTATTTTTTTSLDDSSTVSESCSDKNNKENNSAIHDSGKKNNTLDDLDGDNDDDDDDGKNSNTNHDDQENNTTMFCTACHHVFCRIHGDLHGDPRQTTCQEYLKSKEAQQVLKTEQTLQKYTKPCSHCGCHIFKAAGCDHIVCSYCHQDMCWKCGTHLYLTGDQVRQCHACMQSYLDHRYLHIHRLRTCLLLPIMLPWCLVYTALMTTMALISACFCCCCACTLDYDPERRPASFTSSSWKPTPLRSILVGLGIIVLPLLILCHDLFGWHMEFLDFLVTGGGGGDDDDNNDGDGNNNNNNNNNSISLVREIPTLIISSSEDEEDDEQDKEKQQQQTLTLRQPDPFPV